MFLETHSLSKVVKKLLIINVAVFFAMWLLRLMPAFVAWFSLIPQLVIQQMQIWRLVTYLFIHAGVWHLVFNMFVLWMFGPAIERRMGSGQFLFYYLFTGIGAGFVTTVFMFNSLSFTIGASGSIFGLLVAFGMMYPDMIISMIFPPVSMKAKHFVIVIGVIQLMFLAGGSSGINYIAHLGGMAFGYLYLRNNLAGYRDRGLFAPLTLRWRRIRDKWTVSKRQSKKHFMEEEIDPILDKISKVGIKGLSRRERQILKKAKQYRSV